ncbi:MAG: response regulator [Deltaproteobacteria bacterium]|nr:response regulator [Deltaproteobacteria bacterium]
MSVVSVFSASFCREDEFIENLRRATGYELLNDEMIVNRASSLCSIPAERLKRSFSTKTSVFDAFTRERQRFVTWLKLALAEYLQEGRFLLHGFSAHLVPESIRHVLRICLIADTARRVEDASLYFGISETEAAVRISEEDHNRAFWVQELKGISDPWNPDLYDMVLPTNKIDIRETVELVKRSLSAEALQASGLSRMAARDFLAAARIEAHLAGEGHIVKVSVKEDEAFLTIDRPVLMQERLEEELRAAVRTVKIFKNVKVETKPADEQSEIYQKYHHELPSKVLLVDDEREFVQTLSERLGMRNIGSAAAFDGESALALVREDEPEVLLLDLRMPGIDGMEVLKKVKSEHPEIEVIILTGHGTDVDRKQCLQLGAFAYLEKPVDIELLSDTLKKANEKMRCNTVKKPV